MNWVGGARSRLRVKQEKKIQQQFFERKRQARLAQELAPRKACLQPDSQTNTASSHGFRISQDLLSLETVLKAHDFKSKKPGEWQPRAKAKYVELDHRASSRIQHNIGLPEHSTSRVSQLELDKPDQNARSVGSGQRLRGSCHIAPLSNHLSSGPNRASTKEKFFTSLSSKLSDGQVKLSRGQPLGCSTPIEGVCSNMLLRNDVVASLIHSSIGEECSMFLQGKALNKGTPGDVHPEANPRIPCAQRPVLVSKSHGSPYQSRMVSKQDQCKKRKDFISECATPLKRRHSYFNLYKDVEVDLFKENIPPVDTVSAISRSASRQLLEDLTTVPLPSVDKVTSRYDACIGSCSSVVAGEHEDYPNEAVVNFQPSDKVADIYEVSKSFGMSYTNAASLPKRPCVSDLDNADAYTVPMNPIHNDEEDSDEVFNPYSRPGPHSSFGKLVNSSVLNASFQLPTGAVSRTESTSSLKQPLGYESSWYHPPGSEEIANTCGSDSGDYKLSHEVRFKIAQCLDMDEDGEAQSRSSSGNKMQQHWTSSGSSADSTKQGIADVSTEETSYSTALEPETTRRQAQGIEELRGVCRHDDQDSPVFHKGDTDDVEVSFASSGERMRGLKSNVQNEDGKDYKGVTADLSAIQMQSCVESEFNAGTIIEQQLRLQKRSPSNACASTLTGYGHSQTPLIGIHAPSKTPLITSHGLAQTAMITSHDLSHTPLIESNVVSQTPLIKTNALAQTPRNESTGSAVQQSAIEKARPDRAMLAMTKTQCAQRQINSIGLNFSRMLNSFKGMVGSYSNSSLLRCFSDACTDDNQQDSHCSNESTQGNPVVPVQRQVCNCPDADKAILSRINQVKCDKAVCTEDRRQSVSCMVSPERLEASRSLLSFVEVKNVDNFSRREQCVVVQDKDRSLTNPAEITDRTEDCPERPNLQTLLERNVLSLCQTLKLQDQFLYEEQLLVKAYLLTSLEDPYSCEE